ncbi:MAG TPA: HAMP domain-containing protein, partial [Anaerolineae bacterium]|nr:HAMP domain-containing protein [Anaerolineae bacterium]
MTGFVFALVLMAVIGGTTLIRLNQIESSLEVLTNDLDADEMLAQNITSKILLVRFYSNKYIRAGQHEADLTRYHQEVAEFNEMLTQAQEDIRKPERVEMVEAIRTGFTEYQSVFDQIIGYMNHRNQVLVEVLNVQGPRANEKLAELQQSAYGDDDPVATFYAAKVNNALLLMRLDVFKFLEQSDPQWLEKFDERYQQAQMAFAQLDQKLRNPDHHQLADEAKAAVEVYAAGFQSLQADYLQQNELIANKLDAIGPEIRKTAANIVSSVSQDVEIEKANDFRLIAQTRTVVIGVIGTAILVSLGFGIVVTRSITGPLRQVTTAAQGISRGDVEQVIELKSQDELGQLAEAFRQLIGYVQQMATAAGHLAQGDLRVQVNPLSEQDVLGNAFSQMVNNLRQLVGQVTDNATHVGTASEQLAASANQAGQATNQIAATVQQVAQGIQQQSQAIIRTAVSVRQVSQAVDNVAKGAQEQAQAITQTSHGMSDLVQAVRAIAGGAEEQTQAVFGAQTPPLSLDTAVTQIAQQTQAVAQVI